jgi:hypothetical protein
MKTLPETPVNTEWHHYRTQPADMTSRVQRRINQLEREERERLVNFEDDRYQRPQDSYEPQGRQWPWALLVIGIMAYIIYALMTSPDWLG